MNRLLKIRQTADRKVHWVSDTHLNHNRDFIYEPRGFKSAKEHTDGVIDEINKNVRPNDILMHAGDFSLNTDENGLNEILARIHCQNIYTTWGNHNAPLWSIYKREIARALNSVESEITYPETGEVEIYPFRYKNIVFLGNYCEVVVDGQYFIMAHYPIHVWNYVKDGAKMICGHSHYGLPFSQADNLDAKILDVGWEGLGRPYSTEEVLNIMNSKRIFDTGDHHVKKISV